MRERTELQAGPLNSESPGLHKGVRAHSPHTEKPAAGGQLSPGVPLAVEDEQLHLLVLMTAPHAGQE